MELRWIDLLVTPLLVCLLAMLFVMRHALGVVLYGFVPSLGRTTELGMDAPECAVAERKYGDGLKACGFHHLGAYRFAFPFGSNLGVFDVWLKSGTGVVATVLPRASQLMLVSYFDPGPAAVVSCDVLGDDYRRPGYWKQHVLGLSVEVLLERHARLVQAFADGTEKKWLARTDAVDMKSLRISQQQFSAGYGRIELIGLGLRRVARIVSAFVIAAFVMGALVFAVQYIRQIATGREAQSTQSGGR